MRITRSLPVATLASGLCMVLFHGGGDSVAQEPSLKGEAYSSARNRILAAFEARESSLMDVDFHARMKLVEINPDEPVVVKYNDGQGATGQFGNGKGKLVSEVDFYFSQKVKWRLNLALLESPDLPIAKGKPYMEFASDGTEYTSLNRLTGQGVINKPSIAARDWSLPGNLRVPTEYWLTLDSRPFSELFKNASARLTIHQSDKAAERDIYKVRLSRPQPDSYVDLRLNATYGFSIESLEIYEPALSLSVLFKGRMNIGNGIWLPQSWKVRFYAPQPTGSVALNVSREWLLINLQQGMRLVDEMFRIQFPVGTVVSNNLTDKGYQVGAPVPGVVDVDLLSQVRQLPLQRAPAPEREQSHRRLWLILVNVSVVAIIVAILIRLRLKKRGIQ